MNHLANITTTPADAAFLLPPFVPNDKLEIYSLPPAKCFFFRSQKFCMLGSCFTFKCYEISDIIFVNFPIHLSSWELYIAKNWFLSSQHVFLMFPQIIAVTHIHVRTIEAVWGQKDDECSTAHSKCHTLKSYDGIFISVETRLPAFASCLLKICVCN